MDPILTAGLTTGIGSLAFLPALLIYDAIRRKRIYNFRRLWGSRPRILILVSLTLVSVGLNLAYIVAVQRIALGLANAAEIAGTLLVTAVIDVVRGKGWTNLAWAVPLIGCLAVYSGFQGGDLLGLLLGALCGAGIGLRISLPTWTADIGEEAGYFKQVAGIASGLLQILIFLAVGRTLASLSQGDLASTLAIGLIGTGVPAALEVAAAAVLSEGTIGLLLSTSPVFGVVVGLVVLKQPPPTGWHLVGLIGLLSCLLGPAVLPRVLSFIERRN